MGGSKDGGTLFKVVEHARVKMGTESAGCTPGGAAGSESSPRRRDHLYLLAVVGSAIYFAVGVLWLRSRDPAAVGSNDTYMYVYPNFLYALRSLRAGTGFFWNPYQDCGQPFFAISQTGLLYPVNWFAALLEREPALLATIIVNLSIAGAGAYQLGRQLRLTRSAAVCAALAFELGGSAMDLAAWSPIHIGSYAWLPVVLWLTERLLRQPGLRCGVALGLALTMQLLPGFPQLVFFSYQLVGLRVAWALLSGETPHRMRLLQGTLVALTLPLALVSVQLVPSLETARASLRSMPLRNEELGGFRWSWSAVRVLGSIDLLGLALAFVGLVSCRSVARSAVLFYAFVGALYCGLSLGPGTPLFDLYAHLPLGGAFRGSARLLWVAAVAIAVLTGVGMQALVDFRGRGIAHAWSAIVAVVVGAPLLHRLTPEGLGATGWILAAALLVTAVASATRPRLPIAAVLPLLVAFHGVVVVPKPFSGLRAGDLYSGNAEAFRAVQARLTAQDRVLIVGRPGDYALMPKSAMLFAVPDIFDYEPQVSRSYAEFFTYMRTGRGVQILDDWYWIFRRLLPDTVQPRLFDLTATRFLLVDRRTDHLPPPLHPRLRLLGEHGAVRIYENSTALPRAFYVPRIIVKPAEEILPALVNGSLDPARVAVVSQPPRSGFLGTDAGGVGSAEIVDNAPEHVSVRVHATAPGFLYLADQFFPGWRVQVNGEEHELLRANYTFRLVEIPAGDSEVVFTYRPRAVRIGAMISLVSLAVLIVCCASSPRWRTSQRSASVDVHR